MADLHRAYVETRDPDLARELVEAHTGLAHRLAGRFTNRGEAPEDLIQVAMLGLVKAIEAGGLRRSASIDARVGPDDERSLASSLGADDPDLVGVDRNVTLAAVVQRLPEVEQEIVRLRFVEGLTQLEIAQRVGRSQMQISRLLARSLERLRGWVTDGPAA